MRGVRKGVIFTFVSQYLGILFQILLTSLLARLLTPNEFGEIAIILIFINFFQLMSHSLTPGIVQFKSLSITDLKQLFYTTFIIGAISVLLFILLSVVLDYVYKTSGSKYFTYGLLLAPSVFFSCISSVPIGINKRKLRLYNIAVIQVISILISGIVCWYMAIQGYSIFSLIAQSTIVNLLLFIGNYLYCKELRIGKFETPNRSKMYFVQKYIFDYTKANVVFDSVNFFSRNVDTLLIGKFYGNISLGIYDKAYRLMLYPVANFNSILTKTLHPIVSNFSNHKNSIYQKYIEMLIIISQISFILSIYLIINAKDLIIIFFGAGWEEAIILFQILSCSIPFQLMQTTTGSLFLALNTPKFYSKTGWYNALINLILCFIGVYSGNLQFFTWMVVFSIIINFFLSFYFLITKTFDKNYIRFLKMIFKYGLISLGFGYGILNLLTYLFNLSELQYIYNIIIQIAGLSILLLFIYIINIKRLRKFKEPI